MPEPVSLILTTYNEHESVTRFFEGISQWTRLPDEVVIVDGGSTDGTAILLDTFAPKAPIPIHVIHQPGCNIAQGRNIAIRHAHHAIIACTDMGCVIKPEWLERVTTPFDDPKVDSVAGYYDIAADTPWRISYKLLAWRDDIPGESFIPSSRSIAFRVSAWKAAGGYPEDLIAAEDTLFAIRLREGGRMMVQAPGARVQWIPRDGPRLVFRQYFRYARGAGNGGVQPLQYLFHTGNVGLLTVLFILAIIQSWSLPLLCVDIAWCLWIRILRKPAVRAALGPVVFFRCVILTIAMDIGSVAGFWVGFGERLMERRRTFVPPEDR